jgi:SPX domain protein involved in polyphosphate accumulation
MKFGETLSRRSVPQWRTHDLEYDEIKTLIKVQTSSQDGCSREFEKTLLGVLDSELERVQPFSTGVADVQIDEFVRCKAGEIERRLSACQRTVKTLSKEQGKDEGDNKQSSQSSLKRFFKIEAEIDRYNLSPVSLTI